MWSCPNCGSWIFASRICPNCGAWVGDDSADEQDSDHPVELAIMGDTLLSCSGREAKVVVPAGVKELEEYSFYNDTALQEIELPEDLTMILKGAFQECTALQEIRLPDKLKRLGRAAFYGCSALRKIEIPASVKQINTETFRDCTALRVIELSEGLEIIGGYVFEGCNALEKIVIPASVKQIELEAFQDCTALQEIELSEGLEKIGESAFKNCSALKKITIPASVKQIEASAFRDCIALQEITLLSKDTTFETDTFRNCPGVVKRPEDPVEGVKRSGPMDLAEGGTVLKKYHGTDACVIVPAGVTAIAKECFVNCMSLQEIELPEGLEEIGKSASCHDRKRLHRGHGKEQGSRYGRASVQAGGHCDAGACCPEVPCYPPPKK